MNDDDEESHSIILYAFLFSLPEIHKYSVFVFHILSHHRQRKVQTLQMYIVCCSISLIRYNTEFFSVYIRMHSSEEYKYTMYDSFAYQLTV